MFSLDVFIQKVMQKTSAFQIIHWLDSSTV
jgi:hypothetical protein